MRIKLLVFLACALVSMVNAAQNNDLNGECIACTYYELYYCSNTNTCWTASTDSPTHCDADKFGNEYGRCIGDTSADSTECSKFVPAEWTTTPKMITLTLLATTLCQYELTDTGAHITLT